MGRMVLILMLLAAVPAGAGEYVYMTGERLRTYCASVDSVALDRGLCEGYLSGLVDAATTLHHWTVARAYICVSPEVTPFRLREVYLKWVETHPQGLDGAASGIALNAFQANFPCQQ